MLGLFYFTRGVIKKILLRQLTQGSVVWQAFLEATLKEFRPQKPPFFSGNILDDFQVIFAGRDQLTEGLRDQDGRQRGHLEEVVPVGVFEKVRMSDYPLPEVHQRLLKFGQMWQTLSNKFGRGVEQSWNFVENCFFLIDIFSILGPML